VLDCADEGEIRAREEARLFWHKAGGKTFEFTDFWDHDLSEYTHHFVWCCYALAWGIKKYDETKSASAGGAA